MKKYFRIFTFAAIILILTAGIAFARNTNRRVILILAGNMSIRDMADPGLRNLNSLLRDSSISLMNIRTGRASKEIEPTSPYGMEAACVSLGAGAMAIGGAEVRRAGGVSGLINNVPTGDLYLYRTGLSFGKSMIVHTELPKMQKVNLAASYHARPGALGAELHKAGIKTAVIGNSDLPGDLHREAVAAAMDDKGQVDFGSVDSPALVKSDSKAPYGMRTDTDLLLSLLGKELSRSGFIMVDFGDTNRADSYAQFCTDDQAIVIRHQAALRLDRFISQVKTKLDSKNDLLILLSPNARSFSDIEQERLAPVIFNGPGFGSGMLASASTRRAGVVTLSDIAPSVLQYFNLTPPADMMGRPVRHEAHKDAVAALLKMNTDAAYQAQRQVAMRGGSVVQSIVVVLVMLCIIIGVSYPLKKTAAWVALVPVAVPSAMLCLPLIYSGGLVGAIILLTILTLCILGLSALIFRSPVKAFVAMCAALVAGMAVDLMLGAPISSGSIAGYSLVEGARYYGIGNEMMGTVLGATLIGLGIALSGSKLNAKIKGALVVVIFAIVFFVIGAPNMGANTGGALAAAPAMLVALLARRGWKPSVRGLALVILITVLLVGGLIALDAMHGAGSQSHMGRVVDTAKDSSGSGFFQIVQRKVTLNFMLLATSPWSRLLGLSLAGSIVLYWLGMRRFGTNFLGKEQAAAALGCCFGVAGGFAFNDSGVLAAATCAVFLWILLAQRMLRVDKQPKDV